MWKSRFYWVTSGADGVWRKSFGDKRIRALRLTVAKQLEENSYQMSLFPEFNPKANNTKCYTPFQRSDGTSTPAGPVTDVDDEDPKYCTTPNKEVADAEGK
ncbi:unnamed protein product [Phytophthora fragariaefolia]|uniref:Unnamed protein product n=1 Tax=Phytophthora fragariaefolia TaxID=1490495 RepID=A0A9W7D503_9STRA|nr:unnamed protein product [Phytophthora fragariaefolia]